jgi:hypothetical protein
MNIDLWQVTAAVVAAAVVTGAGMRWWCRRDLVLLQRRHDKLDADYQSTLKVMSQTRKQVDDLQRLVAEHRRNIAAIEQERRRVSAKLAVAQALEEPVAMEGGMPSSRVAGGWADTQPL